MREHGEGYSSGKSIVAQPDLDLERPTEEATTIDTSPATDYSAVCGFSEESGMIGIDVAGLPVSLMRYSGLSAVSVNSGIISYAQM